MNWLKAELHAHCSDDPRDDIDHSAEMLIDAVAAKHYDVLAITCHGALVYNEYLAEYARRRDVLLLPGIESYLDGRHVLILNPGPEHLAATTFAELRAAGPGDAAVIAPHPFYPGRVNVREKLFEYRDVFHAVEYCNFYVRGLNFNRRAEKAARELGLPLIGTSDTHVLPFDDSTFAWIQAEREAASVIRAVRSGAVRLQTRPRPLKHVGNMLRFAARQAWRDRHARRDRGEAAA